ncbi:MAG: NTPase [Candidatus Methanosuratincola sp.]
MVLKRLFLLTGPPGVGKTTVVLQAIALLMQSGLSVGGMVTREVRDRGTGARVGFEVEDIATGRRGWLARVSIGPGPRVGRYVVDTRDLERVGASAISDAAVRSDVIAIDEIGPMELFSNAFRSAVEGAVDSGKPVVATVHLHSSDPVVVSLKEREDAEVFVVSPENRGSLPGIIAHRASALLVG